MSVIKKVSISVFMLVIMALLLPVAFADFSFQVETQSEGSNKIYKDQEAVFELTINNNNNFDDSYSVYSPNPSWDFNFPEIDGLPSVPAGESKTFTLEIYPRSLISESGIYSLKLKVKSVRTKEHKEEIKDIMIKSDAHREFQPSVSLKAKFLNAEDKIVIDPRKDMETKLIFSNRNALDINKLDVVLESPFFKESFTTSIPPNNDLIKTLNFDLDPFIIPQEAYLDVKAFYKGSLIIDKSFQFNISENKIFFQRESSSKRKFMYERYKVNITNYGNVPNKETFSYKIGMFENFFTKTQPDSNFVKEDGKGYLEFDISLDPAETQKVVITTDYRPWFYTTTAIILIMILVLVLYYTFRSPLLISKKMTIMGEKDGGTSEIKVLLSVRNRTNKVLENVMVVDRIPDITEIEKEFTLGTLKPSKVVKHPKKGTLIKWNFPVIEGYEERLITYKIHSKLGILGKFTPPPALVKFALPNGKTKAVKSNSVDK
ncbi:MAG: hypothetical protein ACQESP_11725 [Candidatus Muiribacteriota bacterium]